MTKCVYTYIHHLEYHIVQNQGYWDLSILLRNISEEWNEDSERPTVLIKSRETYIASLEIKEYSGLTLTYFSNI